MIPENRPVLGMDLEELSQKLELSVMDACWTFGLNMPAWSLCVNKNGAEPVKDVALALLVRYLDMFPESCPVERPISPSDFYFSLDRYNKMQPKEDQIDKPILESFAFFGSILGRDHSAGYRWVKQDGGTRPVIDRYIHVLNKDLAQGVITLKEVRTLTIVESKAREIDISALMSATPNKKTKKTKKTK